MSTYKNHYDNPSALEGRSRTVLTRRRLTKLGVGLGAGATTLGSLGVGQLHAQAEPIEISVWLGGEPGTVNSYTAIFEEYQAANPNVTVKPTFVGSDLFNPSLLPALNAGEGPNIWMGGTGPGQPAAIIQAGHALDLTPYYCELGWNAIIPETIVNTTSSDGKLWAVGDSVETTVMFYNKDIFAANGLDVPTTWEEFTEACDTLLSAGFQMPIGLGAADRWPISHWQSMLWGRYAGPEGLEHVMFGDGRWDEEPFVEATATLQELNKAGYFGPEPLAVFQDEMIAQFWRGEIPMVYTGPWIIGQAVRDLGEGVSAYSVFQVPPPVEDTPIYPTEDIGQGWYINSQFEHADIAADLIDFLLFRPESRQALLESGDDIPVGELDLADVELPTLLEEVLASKEEYRENGFIHAFLDVVMPAGVTDVTYDGLQALIAGQMTPEEFTGVVQAAWEEAKSQNLHLQPGGVSC